MILDTNAVLDWLVFRDACMRGWARAIEQGELRWLSCEPMRAELVRTLSYAQLVRWRPDCVTVLQTHDRWAQECLVPRGTCSPGLQCTDPDDQLFVDLGLFQGARWLVTKDRALLRLARAARDRGLMMVKPLGGTAALTTP